MALRRAHHRAADAFDVEQLVARAGRAERDVALLVREAQRVRGERVDVDLARIGRRLRRLGHRRPRRARGHEEAGARARLDQAHVLQRAVGLHRGGQRHAVLRRQVAQRRQPLAARQHAGADRRGERLGDLQVERVGRVHAPFCLRGGHADQYRWPRNSTVTACVAGDLYCSQRAARCGCFVARAAPRIDAMDTRFAPAATPSHADGRRSRRAHAPGRARHDRPRPARRRVHRGAVGPRLADADRRRQRLLRRRRPAPRRGALGARGDRELHGARVAARAARGGDGPRPGFPLAH